MKEPPAHALVARKTSTWRTRFEMSRGGEVVATWDGALWRPRAQVVSGGQQYDVRGDWTGTRYAMTGLGGAPVATAEGVGRSRWVVRAAAVTYELRQPRLWSTVQEWHVGEAVAGQVSRVQWWRDDTVVADLRGMPLLVQVFTTGVTITSWTWGSE